ncbi:tetratricopeptide [Echria macrotheca]|uniref:Tetratricopeptide n=1 Tax=Echria macrotheca TaxID=438768 RepID=A0AAJ0F3H4_9PEZI|nr:tetratricopeptide [Echria macrotheca]
MASIDCKVQADEARKRGNELYKLGKLTEAEAEYKKAAKLDPQDPAPLSNLSSVKFELGHYAAAAAYILKALDLTGPAADGDQQTGRKRNTLYERLAKCYMHDSCFEEAEKIIDNVSDVTLQNSIRQTLKVATEWPRAADAVMSYRSLVFDRIPRFQACLLDVPEYYAIGHDSLIEGMESGLSPSEPVSMMFCGSGDGRHIFATILRRGLVGIMGKRPVKHLHITMVDLKAAAIARTLILMDMMLKYSIMAHKKVPGSEDAPVVMAYLYAGHVVPAAVNEKLQDSIKELVEDLEEGNSVFDGVFLAEETKKAVLRVLKQWQSPLDAGYYRTGVVRTAVRNRSRDTAMQLEMVRGKREDAKGLEKDRKSFDDLAVLLPSEAFAERRDPALVDLMKNYHKGSKSATRELAAHVDANWVTNWTLIDFDDVESCVKESIFGETDEQRVPAIEWDPLDLTQSLVFIGNLDGVLESVGAFFTNVSRGLLALFGEKCLTVEAIVGEMTDTMERIRWDCLEGRRESSGKLDPSKFPRKYDRIHMSNIPDYVGGVLTVAMYGRPLLREDRPSNLRFNVLLNCPMFSTHEDFQAEYALMHDAKQLENHFGLSRISASGSNGFVNAMMTRVSATVGAQGSFMFEDYMLWEQRPMKTLSRGKDLLPRPALEKWIYGHFLKIALPNPRPDESDRPIYSPLNFTALLRLICHLAEIGCPAHWLSTILITLCGGGPNGNMTTTARPPKMIVTTKADVDAVYPAMAMTVAPWVAQFTTLVSIWSPLMPFGCIAPPGVLVSAAEIGEFSVSFRPFTEDMPRAPHFVLVFWNGALRAIPGYDELRRFLRDDEQGDKTPTAARIRREGVHVINTMKYVTATFTASFWCRKDVMRSMSEGDSKWRVYLLRVDEWTQAGEAVYVKDCVKMQRLWTE